MSQEAKPLVCPLMSIRHNTIDTYCIESDCALYLPAAKKCALVFIGYKAMVEVQRLQQRTVSQ
ncbi:MAG: hypothetical protein AAGI66_08000 [Cyanobacteria bacterium P01_H01_bin.74]